MFGYFSAGNSRWISPVGAIIGVRGNCPSFWAHRKNSFFNTWPLCVADWGWAPLLPAPCPHLFYSRLLSPRVMPPAPLPLHHPIHAYFFSSDLHFAISTQDRALYFWAWIFLEVFLYLWHQLDSLVSSDGYVIYTEIGVWDFLCLLVLLKT